METTRENYNQFKCEVVEPSPNGYVYGTTHEQKAQGTL